MKYKYYITDLFWGGIVGTNDDQVANDLSYSDDHFVLNSETGKWHSDGKEIDIEEFGSK